MYIILAITFFLGGLCGGFIVYHQIRIYRKKIGLPEDPFEAGEQYFI